MLRCLALAALLTGCVADPADPTAPTDPALGTAQQAVSLAFQREHVTADVYHYSLVLPVGRGPNAGLRIHRIVRESAPFVPRRTTHAAMLLHGDFAAFLTNFAPTLATPASPAPGLAPYLAAHDIDVWGVDRRWTLTPAAGDTSDFGTMGVAQDASDLRAALAFARATRGADGSGRGTDRLALLGFSHGAQLAYTYAALEGARPPGERSVGALVALDFLAAYAPADAGLRATSCANAESEYRAVADGFTDAPNDFFIAAGELDRTAPTADSPLLPGLTNRDVVLLLLGQTWQFAPITPNYHLLQPVLDANGNPTGFAGTSQLAADQWIAAAPPHESMLESGDFDALLCGSGSLPVSAPLAAIRVPLLYIGAAGGVGARGVFTTTQVSSTDVTARLVQRFPEARQVEDFGHGDLLYATDAEALAWRPLASWLARH